LRAEDAICLVNHNSHRLINADAKKLIAETQEMGLKALVALCNVVDVRTSQPVLANAA